MASTVRTIDSQGNPGRLKLRKVREHEAAGAGKFDGEGVFVFTRRADPDAAVLRHSPTIGQVVARPVISDSGQSGFLRYPMPCGSNSGPQYPGLARRGAGL